MTLEHRADDRERPYRIQDGRTVAEEEWGFLRGIAIAVRAKCIAEVGTGSCRSLNAWVSAQAYLKEHLDQDCTVWSCDINKHRIAEANAGYPTAKLVRGDSAILAVAMKDEPPPDIIFIDGLHKQRAVTADIANLRPLAVPGTVWLLHDIRDYFAKLRTVASQECAYILPTPMGIAIFVEGQQGRRTNL